MASIPLCGAPAKTDTLEQFKRRIDHLIGGTVIERAQGTSGKAWNDDRRFVAG